MDKGLKVRRDDTIIVVDEDPCCRERERRCWALSSSTAYFHHDGLIVPMKINHQQREVGEDTSKRLEASERS